MIKHQCVNKVFTPNGRIWFELLFFLLNFILMSPVMLLMWMDEKKKTGRKYN